MNCKIILKTAGYLLLILLYSITVAMAGGEPDIGIITALKGDVQYESVDSKEAKALAFMKVRNKDRFVLPNGGEIQLVYFKTGRKETWKGPAVFVAGLEKGISQNGKAKVSNMAGNVAREVKIVASIIDPKSIHRTGSSQVRGVLKEGPKELQPSRELDEEDILEVNQAKKTYKEMLKTAGPNDITPELYLFGVLSEFDQYDEMKGLIESMKKKQPENTGLSKLSGWMLSQEY